MVGGDDGACRAGSGRLRVWRMPPDTRPLACKCFICRVSFGICGWIVILKMDCVDAASRRLLDTADKQILSKIVDRERAK